MNFFSIGVFGLSENDFFQLLIDNKVNTFCDIRQRRAVRGSKYSFVNSKKLQTKLSELNINYVYVPELAPTDGIREIQKRADAKNNDTNVNRKSLSADFTKAYRKEILDKFDIKKFVQSLKNNGASGIVFFCVEERAEACHRSIVTSKIHDVYNSKITHLVSRKK